MKIHFLIKELRWIKLHGCANCTIELKTRDKATQNQRQLANLQLEMWETMKMSIHYQHNSKIPYKLSLTYSEKVVTLPRAMSGVSLSGRYLFSLDAVVTPINNADWWWHWLISGIYRSIMRFARTFYTVRAQTEDWTTSLSLIDRSFK